MKILDLFAGIGGFSLGLKRAGFEFEKHWFSEIDKHCIANYKNNFKDAEHIGSVTDVRGSAIGQPDIITFGSPCQDFSLAGNRGGLEGQKSVLILEAIRIIRECRPSIFIWENVKGAFSTNGGADFWAIIAAFTNIGGYRLEWQLLNTSWFLPQNRERIYLVGHLAGRSEPRVFPIGEEIGISGKSESNAEKQIASCLQSGGNGHTANGEYKGMNLIKQISVSKESGGKQPYQQNRVYDTEGISPALLSGLSSGAHAIKVKSNTKQGFEVATIGDSINFSVPNSTTRRGRVGKGVAQTLDTQSNQGVFLKSNIRRLTEIECERLQGFPDDWTKYGNYDGEVREISKTQRYKMCGNAVTVDVVEEIGKRLLINR